jgi:predicted nuclease of predicted toxin-antitoxin system
MSSSTRTTTRFLLDENVRAELDSFLRQQGYDVRRLSKGAPDSSLAWTSKSEKRIIVTNDQDFASFPSEKVFSVVVLRIPQRDVEALLTAFQRLLAECTEWKSRAIILATAHWTISPLAPQRRTGTVRSNRQL